VVAIIPARGGSKGLPRKNALPLCGKPLVAYSIEAAFSIQGVDRVVVSTEDDKIAAIAQSYGQDVAMRRPRRLAGDHSKIEDSITNVSLGLKAEGYNPDMSIILLLTHPFRNRDLMNSLARIGMQEGRPIVLNGPLHYPGELLAREGKGWPVQPAQRTGRRAAKAASALRPVFIRSPGLTGAPYLHMLDDPISLIDIDYAEDFLLAEEIIKNNMFDFG